jgi:hypothetical protein
LRKSLSGALLAAVVALMWAPAASPASHTAYVDETGATVPGCQVKGLWLVPVDDPPGTLAPGAYRYAVTALDAQSNEMAPACEAEVTSVEPPRDAVLLNWRSTPGAAAYRVYRGPFTGPGSPNMATAATTVPAAATGCAGGGRCSFHDAGATQSANSPTFAASLTQAGSPVDFELVQRVDYGGADPDSSATNTSDDPFPAAIRTDTVHFPAGLVPNPNATRNADGTVAKCPLYGENSLLGHKDTFGSDDPDEDACPANTAVGTVKTVSRVPAGAGATRIQISVGDIYNGQTKGSEAGRLFVVIRPACSSGSAVTPGSPACQAALGQPPGSPKPFEAEREFLASVATIVDRGNGAIGVDAETVRAEDDGPLPQKLGVLVPGPGGALTRAPAAQSPDVQVRMLEQNLSGFADQGTADKGDDVPFLVLPTSCAEKAVSAVVTTHQDAAGSAGSARLTVTGCENVPFAPTIEALLGGPQSNAPDAFGSLSVTVRQKPGESATRSATVNLPSVVGPALTSLSRVCSKSDFGRGACPPETQKGEATATTPLLPIALSGPVHLIDNAPDLPQIGVTLTGGPLPAIRFLGSIDLGPTGLVNTFPVLPEVPLTSFMLKFAGGPGGLLQNARDLCAGAGNISAGFEGYNGKSAQSTSPVAVDQAGCPSVPPVVPKPLASGKLSAVKKGKPRLTLTLRGGAGQLVRTARLRLPNGLTLDKKKARGGLKVLVSGKSRRKGLKISKGRLVLPTMKSSRIVITARNGALKASKAIRKKASKQRLAFKLSGVDTAGRPYSLTVRLRPRS